MTRESLIIGAWTAVAVICVILAIIFAKREDKKKGKKYRSGPDRRRYVLDAIICTDCKNQLYRFIERRKGKKQIPRFDSQIEQTFRCFTCKIDVVKAHPEGLGESFARTVRVRPIPGQY